MKLGLMKRFYDTVDEERKSPVVDKIATRWFNGEIEASVLRASANFVIAIKEEDRKYFLRFNHSSERTTGFIAAELDYIMHLRGKGINANAPVKSLAGNYIESVETEIGLLHGVVFEGLPGEYVESEELDLNGFERWGAALGGLHEASSGYQDSRIPSWKDHVRFIRETVTEPVILNELGILEKKLDSLQVGDGYGVIHYDFEQDNLLWDDETPGILDFDDFVVFLDTSDIANALQDIHGRDANKFNPMDTRVQAFIKGYRSKKSVTDEELRTVPLVIRFDQVYVYARLLRAIKDSETPDDPEWVTNIREKLLITNDRFMEVIRENPL